ncbi:MAG TPA: 3-hydroxyacyl-ACP dehydratase FabZ [bacterium]|nr:3-hydroxyacyl-ACP dehydratase FabZ [bacterium]HPQ66168.1 3-hydroxyacyl-ACP dehydratase FabZ [bacterium]
MSEERLSGGSAFLADGADIVQLMEYLPHRYPFLLVDRVIEYEEDARIVGLKNVTLNEPFFQGHFPGRPVMPGVLILEALAQLSGLILLKKPEDRGKVGLFLAVDKARFRRMVIPGDQLRLESDVIRQRRILLQVRTRALVGEELACEAEMMFKIME